MFLYTCAISYEALFSPAAGVSREVLVKNAHHAMGSPLGYRQQANTTLQPYRVPKLMCNFSIRSPHEVRQVQPGGPEVFTENAVYSLACGNQDGQARETKEGKIFGAGISEFLSVILSFVHIFNVM